MQRYKSPGGSMYVVFKGDVYYCGVNDDTPKLSSMTVGEFLSLIRSGFMVFDKIVNPALAYGPEHWNSTNS
ncbi:hypothetical protein [Hafnia sp.]|uniref:hypothetical protein n=1 Tax=Hafnia sp. TaxID=1873498 RepID=UPI002FC8ADA1